MTPLQHSQPSPGCIQASSPRRVRPGGQYAHAGVWAPRRPRHVWAQQRSTHERQWRAAPRSGLPLFHLPEPAAAPQVNAEYGTTYALEPCVMAADVYGAEPYRARRMELVHLVQRSWMQRAVIFESIFREQQATTLCLT
ncbi:MAG: hypothetical protein IPH35_09025 [Rhodoferax sp.]|nr:hypothetical protein [Rhodoferax sp.]